MSDATTTAPTTLRRVNLNDVIDTLPLATRRADVLVAVAKALVGSSTFARGGRGLQGGSGRCYDDLGFVRTCVLHARNWMPGQGYVLAETHTVDLPDPALPRGRFDYIPCVVLLQAWGLQRQPDGHPFPVQAGDIVVSLGDPCLTIVTAAATPDRPATYAGVWHGETVTEGPYRDFSRRTPGQFWRMPEVG